MAEQTFNLPDLGEGLTEADLVEWLVADGDEVAIDQHVVVVETAKATVEVPCPYAGRVHTRHGAEGDTIEVGSPLLTVASGSTEATGDVENDGSGAVLVGYGTTDVGSSGSSGRRAARRRQHTGAATPPTTPPRVTASSASDGPIAPSLGEKAVIRHGGGAPKVISPIVRRLASERGLDLGAVTPGPDGIIRRTDVEAAVAGLDTLPRSAPPLLDQRDERVPLTGIRRLVADKLTTSRREIPDATTWVDADATGLVEARRVIGLERGGLLALLGRICVAGLGEYPELNSSVDTERQEIVRHGAIHLGFAADSPRGLVVPVVHDADRLTTRQLAERMVQLVDAARDGTLAPADLTGGTFTLNNYGVFGVDGSTPIINHPEAAMLGVGRVFERPWVVDGELAVRKVVQLGLTFDHRVCDGGVAGGFLRFVADAVERPVQLLGDV
ncbi:dihydrolipoamide acetyltransferase component of pyruvate dehydrogenase complex [Flexivirga endophytica]|uniref:Dihydrolipoamide acetyltransferase component of pyruvate dehydrogenase complex n=1 Tax=Flexivirga endophytica TaxID=1849103 RepID=A0A916WS89_9MICO|nr:dihydrolipoamide acetyltransferase family protein [Flexivirga endophytica]GGB25058.1 dihydrolipoamide acetyltransferase component of pyruvate dehydrogenase complex [Flexivirga endophytica]GHB63771.1 dihydrolipoamide acetyltransferase component of pyruvate dehydrogenase complex [Flexivirga endophytica]